jgi:hypothetical protein
VPICFSEDAYRQVRGKLAARLERKSEAAGYADALHHRMPVLDLGTLGSRFKDPSYGAYLREGVKLAGL